MTERTRFTYLGDKDLARSHRHKAAMLVARGAVGTTQLHDGTTVAIVRSDAVIDCTIASPMHADIAVVVNRFANVQNNAYWTQFYGYNHRKDSMHPFGRWDSGRAYPAPWDLKSGPELAYISDGVYATSFNHFNSSYGNTIGTTETLLRETQICSILEDRITGDADWGTSAGFKTYADASLVSWSSFWHSSNPANMQPLAVNRTDPANPIYVVATANIDLMDNFAYSYVYGTGATWKYAKTKVFVQVHSVGKNSAGQSGGFYVADDIMYWGDSNSTYGEASFSNPAPPIVLPLGNHRVVVLSRHATPSAGKKFGYTFGYQCKIVDSLGIPAGVFTSNGVCSDLTLNAYMAGSSWHYGTENDGGAGVTGKPDGPTDSLRDFYFMRFLEDSSRLAFPLTDNETLFAGYHSYMASHWDLVADQAWDSEIVCLSATGSGVAQKGVIFKYYDADRGIDPAWHPYYTSVTIPVYRVAFLGMCYGGAANVVFCYLSIFEYSPIILPNTKIKRFKSVDGGATWDAGTNISIDNPSDGYNAYFLRTPTWLGNDPVTGKAKIAFGYTRANVPINLNTEYKQVAIQVSVDDGITFTRGPFTTQDADFTLYFGFRVPGRVRGDSVLLDCGNAIDGFRPSPYRHLPTYYGAISPASRDNTNDFGV